MAADNEKLAATKAASVAAFVPCRICYEPKDAIHKSHDYEPSLTTCELIKASIKLVNDKKVSSKRMPTVTKVSDGIKVADKDGYYRIAKDYGEVNQLIDLLRSKGNSVMNMNGFESAKWKSPEVN